MRLGKLERISPSYNIAIRALDLFMQDAGALELLEPKFGRSIEKV